MSELTDSDLTEVEKEQATPLEREPATGPLVPRWFKLACYTVFGLAAVAGVGFLIRSVGIQMALTDALVLVRGDLELNPALESQRVQEAVETLEEYPLYSFLYCNQEILQNEEDDPRMVRAMALEKAINWGEMSRRRQVVSEITANMDEGGFLDPRFTITPEMLEVLRNMIEERRAETEVSYAEQRITETLEWLAAGHTTQPTGAEKRRLQALLGQLRKKLFVAEDADALELLMINWRDSENELARRAAEHFQTMLNEEPTELPEDVREYCAEKRVHFEDLYREGMHRLSAVSRRMLDSLLAERIFLDHPHVYQYLTLLGHRYDGVRDPCRRGAWLLRKNRFTIRYLSEFLEKANINPVMAVETPYLTKDEHERILIRKNHRRRSAALDLLTRITLDYLENPQAYDYRVEDEDRYLREWVVHTYEELTDDERLGDEIRAALRRVREADRATGEPRLVSPGEA